MEQISNILMFSRWVETVFLGWEQAPDGKVLAAAGRAEKELDESEVADRGVRIGTHPQLDSLFTSFSRSLPSSFNSFSSIGSM